MAKTRTSTRHSIARRTSARASPPRGSCRARSCPTTTSTTPTRPTNASPSSTRSAPRPASSSSMPTPAASPKAPISSTAYRKAFACDTNRLMAASSRVNRTLDAEAARVITEILTEVIIAPDATEEAIAIIAKRKNLRLLLAGSLPDPRAAGLTAKTVAGGLLVQSRDNAVVDDIDAEGRDQARADRRRIARSQIRVPRRQARQVQHHRLCQGSRHRRHRRRTDEPGRFRAHRRAQGTGRRRPTPSSPSP